MNAAALTVGLCLIAPVLYAQAGGAACRAGRTELGGTIGRNQYFGDMHCRRPYASSGLNLGMQILLRHPINPYMSLRASLTVGGLAASDLDHPKQPSDFDKPPYRWDYRKAQFTSPLIELAALVELYPFRQYSQSSLVNRPRLMPYGFIGIGGVHTNPTVSILPGATSPPSDSLLEADKKSLTRTALAIPVGVGLRVAVTPAMAVHMEVGYRFTTSDYLDGFHKASYCNSKHNDSYLIVAVGASYRLVGTDRDGDGTPDRCDACPRLYGLAQLGGCPDADNDGVIDPDDSCPDSFGDPATCGCPDDDHDGVPNDCDCCPTEPGERADHGCPKTHQLEDTHVRPPVRLRYCPLCPTDQPNAGRNRRPHRISLTRRQPITP